MACELLTREFKNSEGEEVIVTTRQLSATKALELHVELVNKLGVSVLPFIDNAYNFGDLLQLMQSHHEHAVVSEIIKRVVLNAAISGKQVTSHGFDPIFNGELMLVCRVFAFILEANFKSFFKQGLEINELRRLEAEEQSNKAKQESSSPKT